MTNKTTNSTPPLSSEYDSTIALLNVYFTEWIQRDQMLWTQVFKFYYAILVVILMPYITKYFKISLPSLPTNIFSILGIILSILFLYVSLCYAIRLHAISDTYQNIVNKLPKEYQRKGLKEFRFEKLLKPRLPYVICPALSLSLLILSIILILI